MVVTTPLPLALTTHPGGFLDLEALAGSIQAQLAGSIQAQLATALAPLVAFQRQLALQLDETRAVHARCEEALVEMAEMRLAHRAHGGGSSSVPRKRSASAAPVLLSSENERDGDNSMSPVELDADTARRRSSGKGGRSSPDDRQ